MDSPLESLQRVLTRRRVVTSLGLGSAAVLATRIPGITARAATPVPQAYLPEAIRNWVTGFETLDPDLIASTFAKDAILLDVTTGISVEGQDAISAAMTGLFGAVEDTSAEVHTVFATDEWAAAEWTFGGRYTGQYLGFPPGEGQQLMNRGVDIVALAGDQIQVDHRYYDAYSILVQLGVLAAQGGTGTPAATPTP